MPGGFGTFEEFCEIVTWAQLGMHTKPCGLLNVKGYYEHLLAMFDHAAAEQLSAIRAIAPMVITESDPERAARRHGASIGAGDRAWLTRRLSEPDRDAGPQLQAQPAQRGIPGQRRGDDRSMVADLREKIETIEPGRR